MRSSPILPPILPAFLALLALVALPACVAPPPAAAAEGLSIPPPPPEQLILELRLVLQEDDWRYSRAPILAWEEREVVLGPPHFYGLESVTVVDGQLGSSALEITVSPAHGPPLAEWTRGELGNEIALLEGGEVVLLAKLVEPLPNPFQLHARYGADEAAALAERIAGAE